MREGNTYACKLEHLSSKILQHGGDIDCCLGADAHLVLGVLLQETLDTTAGELVRGELVLITMNQAAKVFRRGVAGSIDIASSSPGRG